MATKSKTSRRTTVSLALDVSDKIEEVRNKLKEQFPDAHIDISDVINNNLRLSPLMKESA